MARALLTRVFPRQFVASLLIPASVLPIVLTCAGCDSRKRADESEQGQQTTDAANPQEVAQDAARIAQLRKIVANRSISALPQAVNQLADSKAPGAFEAIAPGLSNESLMFRMYSAKALGTLGDPRALPLLRKALQSKYTGLRLAAVVGLGKLGSAARPASAELAALLDQQLAPMHRTVKHLRPDEDSWGNKSITLRVHLAVLEALGHIGASDAQKIVTGVLKGAHGTEMEWEAARVLKAMNAREVLLAAAQSGSAAACRMLAELKDSGALPAMLQQVQDPQLPHSRRRPIIYALGVLGDRRATRLLLEMLRSKSDTTCEAAAWSLNRMADPESLPGLIAYVQSAPRKSRGLYSATCAIGAIQTSAALDALRQLAGHPSSSVRGAVTYRLGQRATIQDMPLLVGLLRSPRGSNHVPTKALTRLLPDSAQPLLDLLRTAGPELQIKIARILATHEPARPALRALLKSENRSVRGSVQGILWDQRDPSVPLAELIQRNEVPILDERDVPELKRLASEGNDWQSYVAVLYLFDLEPKMAWEHVRPMFYKDEPAPLRAYNIIGREYPAWVEQEIIGMLKQSEGLSTHARRRLLQLLGKGNSISPEAVALYRMLSDDSEFSIRRCAYECLYREASDESMALLGRKALEGDLPAKWVIGGGPDKRLAETFARLVEKATRKKETWLGGYVHCWPNAPGILDYVSAVGSRYSEQMMEARRIAAQTVPD